jgi:hypothetical protein
MRKSTENCFSVGGGEKFTYFLRKSRNKPENGFNLLIKEPPFQLKTVSLGNGATMSNGSIWETSFVNRTLYNAKVILQVRSLLLIVQSNFT